MFLSPEMLTAVLNALSKLWHLLKVSGPTLHDDWNYKFFIFIFSICLLRGEGGGPGGQKKQVWLISKSNLSWSHYFLRNCKIFVYDEKMARQSSGILLGPIQNIGSKMTENDHFRSIFSKTVQTCLKVRFYQVLHVSVSLMCRNV